MNAKTLEFHYVVSYQEGLGWQIAGDVESAVFPDGTVYDWTQGSGWLVAGHLATGQDIEALDLEHYRVLKSHLEQMNGEYNG